MEDDLWVFGYGSLLWNQGFVHVEQVLATLSGYHRSFCMRSIHHRGTDENPGLVLALDAQEGKLPGRRLPCRSRPPRTHHGLSARARVDLVGLS